MKNVQKKRVKGWAVIAPEGYLPVWGMWANGELLTYTSRQKARQARWDAFGTKGQILSCTIEFSIPRKIKK